MADFLMPESDYYNYYFNYPLFLIFEGSFELQECIALLFPVSESISTLLHAHLSIELECAFYYVPRLLIGRAPRMMQLT